MGHLLKQGDDLLELAINLGLFHAQDRPFR
jgi:hypothetical protein